jgi:eukaryotic-like serine/threonine-protein kinase
MRSTSTGPTPFDTASPSVRLTYLEEPARGGWCHAGALLAQRYELEEPHTGGAPGIFWHARQLRSRRSVTVQLLDPAIVEDAVLMEAFLHEASLAAAVDHAHVARLLDYGIDYDVAGGVPFLVLEHLNGSTLEHQLQQRPRLSLQEVARVLAHAALGLQALHDRGLVHRRLDPAHLIIADDFPSGSFRAGTFTTGSYRVDSIAMEGGATTFLLFAIEEAFRESLSLVHKLSRQLGGTASMGTASMGTASMGTASKGAPPAQNSAGVQVEAGSYQSPEQLLGHAVVDARSDLWSLAVIAFEALTGTRAFGGATLGERLVRICSGEPSAVPAELALPPGFGAWFQRGVRKLPSERFTSAREMCDTFVQLLDP